MKLKKVTTKIVQFIILFSLFIFLACRNTQKNEELIETKTVQSKPFFKLSLAQWSLHKAINDDKTLDPIDFAQKAKEMGFEGLEYVNHLYLPYLTKGHDPKIAMQQLLDTLKMKSELYSMKNLIIMVDGEGDLATPNDEERIQAVENHKKWVDAAVFLGCHSIRVNLFGSDDAVIWEKASTNSLKQLSEYAKPKHVNVIVENHGYLSSNATLLNKVIANVNAENCGTLPDFGNFCLKREDGKRWEAPCIEEYDKYKGVAQLMKYAKAVSAKSYDFDKDGNETTIDYAKMLQIVKDAGYSGYIGVEYEGNRLTEENGIIATKELLLKVAKNLN